MMLLLGSIIEEPEPEIHRRRVDHHVVAGRAPADELHVGDRRSRRPVDLDGQALLEPRCVIGDVHDGATAKRQHRPGD